MKPTSIYLPLISNCEYNLLNNDEKDTVTEEKETEKKKTNV